MRSDSDQNRIKRALKYYIEKYTGWNEGKFVLEITFSTTVKVKISFYIINMVLYFIAKKISSNIFQVQGEQLWINLTMLDQRGNVDP